MFTSASLSEPVFHRHWWDPWAHMQTCHATPVQPRILELQQRQRIKDSPFLWKKRKNGGSLHHCVCWTASWMKSDGGDREACWSSVIWGRVGQWSHNHLLWFVLLSTKLKKEQIWRERANNRPTNWEPITFLIPTLVTQGCVTRNRVKWNRTSFYEHVLWSVVSEMSTVTTTKNPFSFCLSLASAKQRHVWKHAWHSETASDWSMFWLCFVFLCLPLPLRTKKN